MVAGRRAVLPQATPCEEQELSTLKLGDLVKLGHLEHHHLKITSQEGLFREDMAPGGGLSGLQGPVPDPPGQLHIRGPILLPQEKLTSTGLQTGVSSSVSICLRPPITTLPSA